jgi:hypothetical protein
LNTIGTIGKYAVYDLNYYFDQDYDPPDTVNRKSILVRSAPGVYHEIYFREKSQIDAAIPATKLLSIGSNRILEAVYEIGGMYRDSEVEYFFIGIDGPKLMSVDQLLRAAEKSVPEGSRTWHPTAGFDFRTMIWSIGTEPQISPPKVSCCTGRVEVRFKIENGNFVPVDSSYTRH